ncbi:hypothetical protein CR66_08940 [Campylobacter mucosalis]|nr:hypothetical protein CR66_08940 [Campylobacter mucosalis]QKF63726.1 putative membrane protein [Campylobacter mucosalis]
MFECDLGFKDLDEVENELQTLENINFDTILKCSKMLNELDDRHSTYVEKFKLQTLKQKYQKLKSADKIYKEIKKDLNSADTRYLSQKSKENLIDFQNLLANLGKFLIFDIQNSLKLRKVNLQKLKDILTSQKEIIYKHIASKDSDERKILYKQFLKNESELHKIYGKLSSNFLEYYNIDPIKHTVKSILDDSFRAVNAIKTNPKTTFWFCVFFGACFCVPYFINISQVPQTNLNDIIYLLFGVSILAFLYIGYTIVFLMAYGYAIFKNNTENKIISFIFWIMQICMLVICALPFAYDFEKLKWICDIILENFNWTICIYILLFAIYFGFGIYKNKAYKDYINLSILILALCFDLIFISFVYARYQDINFLFLLLTFFLLIFIKVIACLKTFEYKYIFLFSVFVGFAMMPVLSSDFVRIIKLANYKDSFTIKNEFIGKEILEKIPVCFNDYNATCIDKTTSDENKTTINNLLVKVKFDDRYYFKAHIPKDENLTDISQKENGEFKIKKDNILN